MGEEAAEDAMDDSSFTRSTRSRLFTIQGDKYTPSHTDSLSVQKILLKGFLQNTQQIRDLHATNTLFFKMAKNSKMFEAMRSAGATYDKSVKEKGKNHGLGPPCIYTYPALLGVVAGEELSVGGITTKAIKSYLEDFNKCDIKDKCDHIGICSLKKIKDKESVILTIALGPTTPLDTVKTIRKSLHAVGAIHMEGRPPPSALEVVAQDILMQLSKKKP
jgi:hypothetical protein